MFSRTIAEVRDNASKPFTSDDDTELGEGVGIEERIEIGLMRVIQKKPERDTLI